MEPKLSTPNLGPESSSFFHRQSYEQQPNVASSEISESQRFERPEPSHESVRNEASVSPILPHPVVVPQPPMPVAENTTSISTPSDSTPLTAGDDDLIEREWVDKAKKIILETKEDPYRREKEVALLQSDYLKKRYGRELGAS